MCLKKTHDKPRIAQNDIEVWKVLTIWGLSPFKDYQYHPGMNRPAVTETAPAPSEQQYINGGYLHAFRNKEKAEEYAAVLRDYFDDYIVIRMLIPKGTIYYEGAHNDICSERLYWPEEGTAHPNPVKIKEV